MISKSDRPYPSLNEFAPRTRFTTGPRLSAIMLVLIVLLVAAGGISLWSATAVQFSTDTMQIEAGQAVLVDDPVAFQKAVSSHAVEIAQLVAQVRLFSLIVIGLGLVLSVIAFWIIRRVIYLRITRLSSDLQQVSASQSVADFQQLKPLPGNDEIGQLSADLVDVIEKLRRSYIQLVGQVEERTLGLHRRTIQLEVAAQIAQDIAAAQDLDTLLYRAVNIIRDRFNFYHAGIFLTDAIDTYAVLRAATGEAGEEMLARNHRLKIGEVGVVGFVAQTGEARVASDVGQDLLHFKNPMLPETRSEAALPLKTAGKVIGVLDVQSQEPDAFDGESLAILQVMADQLAIAIQYTLLLQKSQENIDKLETAYRQINQQAWDQMLKTSQLSGYEFDGSDTRPIYKTSGSPIQNSPEQEKVSFRVPLRLRGDVIGELDVWKDEGELTEGEAFLLTTLSNRLSQGLESARLFEETRRRAERERLSAEITTKLRLTNDPHTILQTAVIELRKALQTHHTELVEKNAMAEGTIKVGIAEQPEEAKPDR